MQPSLMRCAVVMIRLCAAWRKTSVSRTTGTTPLSIRSLKHHARAHRGQLVHVAHQQQAAVRGSARSRWSSAARPPSRSRPRPAGRTPAGGLSLRVKPPVPGLTSSSRWMVLASTPVASDSRLAARPVGAHSRHAHLLGPQDEQDGVDERRLAHARPAGDDERPAGAGPA